MTHEPGRLVEKLEELKERLLLMGRFAEERLQAALRGMVDRDRDSLTEVVAGDSRINELQIEIDHRCLTLLALNQPVAVDLRTIVSVLKINADLERVSDLAIVIGEAALRYLAHPPVKPLVDLPRMGVLALKMLREALEAFVSRDVSLAHRVLRQDDWVDALRNQILRELLTYMISERHTIEPSLELMLVSRYLERIGDHATNIAEDVIFIVEARDVRQRSLGPVGVERRKGLGAPPI